MWMEGEGQVRDGAVNDDRAVNDDGLHQARDASTDETWPHETIDHW